MNKLVIIGNGFDLAHGLKTSYSDFFLWEINEAFKQPNVLKLSTYHIESPLFTIESNYRICQHPSLEPCKFEDIAEFLQYFKDHKEGKLIVNVKYSYPFIEKLIKLTSKNWVDIERGYFRELVNISALNVNEESRKKMLIQLNQSISLIKIRLEKYLLTINTKIPDGSFINEVEELFGKYLISKTIDNYGIDLYFLNFNYTNTVTNYLNAFSLNKSTVNYIHGQLNDIENPIIFGYGDEMDEHYEKIEKLNNNEYLKHMKSFAYLHTLNYKRLFEFLDKDKFDVFIVGHSCGLSDRLLFTHIFEHKKLNSVKIYHYKKSDTENDFFEKTQNLSRYFRLDSKHRMRTKVLPFDKLDFLPKYKPQN